MYDIVNTPCDSSQFTCNDFDIFTNKKTCFNGYLTSAISKILVIFIESKLR